MAEAAPKNPDLAGEPAAAADAPKFADEPSPAPAAAPAAPVPAPAPAAPAPAAAESRVSAAAAAASSFASDVGSRASATTSAIRTKMSEVGAGPASILIGLIFVAIIGFIIAYGLYWMINTVILNKKKELISGTKNGVTGTQYRRFDGALIPKATNGKRLSFSFWIYINDINKFQGTFRHVFHRGDQDLGKSLDGGASPIVFLDSERNKLYVLMMPITMSEDTKNAIAGFSKDSDKYAYLTARYGITLDYVPLQRWVHVGVVVNENASGGMIMGYIDGELVKSITTGASNTIGATAAVADITGLNLDKVGDVWVGGSPSESVGPGFSGLVSKITFFNYDINAKDMYTDYLSGPIDSMMARLGLPAYGVRSPLYRLG